MGHGHVELPEGMTHRDVATRPAAVVLLLSGLAVAGVAVLVGLVVLWPSGQPLDRDASTAFTAPGVTSHPAEVLDVGPACVSVDAGVAVTAAIGLVAIDRVRLSGLSDEADASLAAFATDLDFQGLLICALIVAGLGVLNDVTITQASSVWELRGAGPELTRRGLYSRAMRIGRDHITSTIYTIVFAYSGAAFSLLLLLYFYDRPLLSVLSTEVIAVEVLRTLASGIGLVLAVPITTAIAALTVTGPSRASTS